MTSNLYKRGLTFTIRIHTYIKIQSEYTHNLSVWIVFLDDALSYSKWFLNSEVYILQSRSGKTNCYQVIRLCEVCQ